MRARDDPERCTGIALMRPLSSGIRYLDMEMKKESTDVKKITLRTWVDLLKNAKFLVVNALALSILSFVFIFGDGKQLALDFYKNATGRPFETYSPVKNFSHEAYLILKAKIVRDATIDIQHSDVSVFRASDDVFKYRIVANGQRFFYLVEKRPNGIWHISRQEE